MNHRILKNLASLITFGTLLFPFQGILASNCACAKPKVTFTADAGELRLKGSSAMVTPDLATIHIDTESSQSPFKDKQMEREKVYQVSISIEPEILVHCTPLIILTFPFC